MPVMQVHECQRAMDRAAELVGMAQGRAESATPRWSPSSHSRNRALAGDGVSLFAFVQATGERHGRITCFPFCPVPLLSDQFVTVFRARRDARGGAAPFGFDDAQVLPAWKSRAVRRVRTGDEV